eukprot:PhM_4_TR5895/c0_g3_i1/m.67451
MQVSPSQSLPSPLRHHAPALTRGAGGAQAELRGYWFSTDTDRHAPRVTFDTALEAVNPAVPSDRPAPPRALITSHSSSPDPERTTPSQDSATSQLLIQHLIEEREERK